MSSLLSLSYFRIFFKMASFLDTAFVDQKVSRIKYLADLHQKIARFDLQLKHGEQVAHIGINPIGIHIIDSELQFKY
jgi:hypothetical protein